MTIEKLEEMGYVKVGEVDGLVLYSNLNCEWNAKRREMCYIFQFNLELQNTDIGRILVSRQILESMLKGGK